MSVRYCGDATIRVTYRDSMNGWRGQPDYAGSVSWPGGSWKFEGLHLAPADERRVASDSPEAYDLAAEAAMGFGSYEREELYGFGEIDPAFPAGDKWLITRQKVKRNSSGDPRRLFHVKPKGYGPGQRLPVYATSYEHAAVVAWTSDPGIQAGDVVKVSCGTSDPGRDVVVTPRRNSSRPAAPAAKHACAWCGRAYTDDGTPQGPATAAAAAKSHGICGPCSRKMELALEKLPKPNAPASAMYLLVKGDKFTAAKSATEHGVPFAFLSENREYGVTTMGMTGLQHEDRVARWFTEPPRSPPYPPGSLLHYYRAGSVPGVEFNPRRTAPFVSGIGDTELSKWEERDRLHINLHRKGDPGKTFAEWWDDDARQMFEDGFFNARKLHESVYQYALDMGLVKLRPSRSNPRRVDPRGHSYRGAGVCGLCDSKVKVRHMGGNVYTCEACNTDACEECGDVATWAANTGAGGIRRACDPHHAEAVALDRSKPKDVDPIPEELWVRINPEHVKFPLQFAPGFAGGDLARYTGKACRIVARGVHGPQVEFEDGRRFIVQPSQLRNLEDTRAAVERMYRPNVRRATCEADVGHGRTCGKPAVVVRKDPVYGDCPLCEECDRYFGKKKPTRPNPALILVHAANPQPPSDVKRAWCKFHERDAFEGSVRDVGRIPGTPDYTFALGRCVDVDLGRGPQSFSPRPWLVFSPKDQSLWIVAEKATKLGNGIAGAAIHAITYDPCAVPTGKEPAFYRHRFDAPRPTFAPVGNPNHCRAVLLDGGVYRVDDWIRD